MPGEYMAYKVSLKYGSLEFVSTLKPEVSQKMMVSVQPTQVNADISLTPTVGGRWLTERENGKVLLGIVVLRMDKCFNQRQFMHTYYQGLIDCLI